MGEHDNIGEAQFASPRLFALLDADKNYFSCFTDAGHRLLRVLYSLIFLRGPIQATIVDRMSALFAKIPFAMCRHPSGFDALIPARLATAAQLSNGVQYDSLWPFFQFNSEFSSFLLRP